MRNRKRKIKKSHRILRGLYRSLVGISATIVALYIAATVAIRPPDVAQAVQPQNNVTEQEQLPSLDVTATSMEGPDVANNGVKARKERCYTFLMAASDDGHGNADTIMVITFDVLNQKIGMISIPRDTVVNTTRKMPKINAAYAKGVETLRNEVSQLLGIPIDFYVTVDIKAFVEVVDAVDGVEFDVPVEMYYDDPTQNLSIHYQPGMQHLNGQEALEVVRFRKNGDGTGYPDSDVGRTRTQQSMLNTLAKKVVSWGNVMRVKSFVDILSRNIKTDLTAGEILYFAMEGSKLNLDTALSGATLPGDGTKKYKGYKWCYGLYREESLALVNQHINPYTQDLLMSDVGFVVVN